MSSQSTKPPTEVEINGIRYQDIGEGRLQRVLTPGERAGRDVDVTVPHPDHDLRKEGYRLAWIFVAAGFMFLCALAGLCL